MIAALPADPELPITAPPSRRAEQSWSRGPQLAVRLQMKLGVVPEHERLPDSPDSVVVRGAARRLRRTRTKGNLYLLVTSRVPRQPRRARRRALVAETIRSEYYYDESAGIRRLPRQGDPASPTSASPTTATGCGCGHGDEPGPDRRRGSRWSAANELYVATVGPAEAYLIRQARLSTLPDPHRERGLPVGRARARGLARRDQRRRLARASSPPNVVAAPRRGRAQGRAGHAPPAVGDRAPPRAVRRGRRARAATAPIASRRAEVARRAQAGRWSRSGRAEPLAGAPDRCPIPLADTVAGGSRPPQSAPARPGARRGRRRASSAPCGALQDVLPRRAAANRAGDRRSSARREMQRRAAVALLAFVAVVGAPRASACTCVGGPAAGRPSRWLAHAPRRAAQRRAERASRRSSAPGVDLVRDDPPQAAGAAHRGLRRSSTRPRRPASRRRRSRPLRDQIVGRPRPAVPDGRRSRRPTLFNFPARHAASTARRARPRPGRRPVRPRRGEQDRLPDRPRRRDGASRSPSGRHGRPGDAGGDPSCSRSAARTSSSSTTRTSCGAGGRSNTKGKGTLVRVRVKDSALRWGDDVKAIGTFVRNFEPSLYNLYVVDPSEQNIMSLLAGRRRRRLPAAPTDRAAHRPRDVDGITRLLHRRRHLRGRERRRGPRDPGLRRLGGRPARGRRRSGRTRDYTLLSSPDRPDGSPSKRMGLCTRSTTANDRIVAFDKGDGDVPRASTGSPTATRLGRHARLRTCCRARTPRRRPPRGGSRATRLHSAVLAGEVPAPDATPTPTGEPPPAPTPKPRKTPRP